MTIAGNVTAIRKYSWRDWPNIADQWNEVAAASPYGSFFTSAEWVAAWLQAFGSQLQPAILILEHAGSPVACCLLVCKVERYGVVPVRRIYLNASGENDTDDTCIEYNTVLSRAGWEDAAAEAIEQHLEAIGWHEFALNGCTPDKSLEALLSRFHSADLRCVEKPSYYVDLARLRREGLQYDNELSANTRQQIRRTKRLYEQSGAVEIHCMSDRQTAFACFEELIHLHEAVWSGRGKAGAFSSPVFTAFHRGLIERVFDSGAIQLLRVTVGGSTVGVLYNFEYGRRVCFYQSGFAYSEDNRFKPGLLAHYLAVQYCLEAGLEEYDFLAGDSQYKKSLGTDSRSLRWLILERHVPRMRLLAGLRSAKQRLLAASFLSGVCIPPE